MTASSVARAKAAPKDRAGSEPVYDLGAAMEAAEVEGAGEAFPFTLRGQKFTIPSSTDWPLEVSAMLAREDLAGAMHELLNGNYERFMGVRPTLGEVKVLFQEVARWSGVETAGN